MPSQIVTATIQSVILSATSNIIAQTLQAYRNSQPLTLDPRPLLNFILFTLLNTPPNFLWQQFLEETFPAYTVAPALVPVVEKAQNNAEEKPGGGGGAVKEIVPAKRLNIRNTATKFCLDQTAGALFNTVVFLAGMGALRGLGMEEVVGKVRNDTWPLMLAGYKLWPLVSLLSFTVVPFEHRMMFGGLVGMGWGIFLSLFAGS